MTLRMLPPLLKADIHPLLLVTNTLTVRQIKVQGSLVSPLKPVAEYANKVVPVMLGEVIDNGDMMKGRIEL